MKEDRWSWLNAAPAIPSRAGLVRAGEVRCLIAGETFCRHLASDFRQKIAVKIIVLLVERTAVAQPLMGKLHGLHPREIAGRVAVLIERPAEMMFLHLIDAFAFPNALADVALSRRHIDVVEFRAVAVPGGDAG